MHNTLPLCIIWIQYIIKKHATHYCPALTTYIDCVYSCTYLAMCTVATGISLYCATHSDMLLRMLQSKLTRQVAQAPGDLGCVGIAPYDITHGFMVSCGYG